MKRFFARLIHHDKGTSAAEYALLVALITAVCGAIVAGPGTSAQAAPGPVAQATATHAASAGR